MAADIKKSIQLILAERIASPFSGTFLFSWFVLNWRLVYFLFSSNNTLTTIEKLNFVDEHYINLNRNLYYPFLSAVLLVAVYPLVTTGALWIWLLYKRWQNNIKVKINKERLISYELWVEAEARYGDREVQFEQLMKTKNDEISRWKREYENAKLQAMDELRRTVDKITGEQKLNEKEIRVMRLFTDYPEGTIIPNMMNFLKLSSNKERLELRAILDQLKTKELLLTYNTAPSGDVVYKLTDKGTALLVEINSKE